MTNVGMLMLPLDDAEQARWVLQAIKSWNQRRYPTPLNFGTPDDVTSLKVVEDRLTRIMGMNRA